MGVLSLLGCDPAARRLAAVPVAVAAPCEAPGIERIALLAPREGLESVPAVERLTLPLDAMRLALPAGRSLVDVAVQEQALVSIGVFGSVDALLAFDVVDPESTVPARSSLDEDGRLPKLVSLRVPLGVAVLRVVVDVAAPVDLARVSQDPAEMPAPGALDRGSTQPLLGFPAPRSRDDGYLLGAPGRYLFTRADVARVVLAALRQTRVRFRRDPIVIGDISQWDGARPASDLGQPRHISHEGGRDLDVALPANDGSPSTLRSHCRGVLIDADRHVCEPGTSRGVDALRLAYFLGLLIDASPATTPVVKVFTDDAYLREIRAATELLKTRRWIKDAGYEALAEDGILRASPWHTDHVHVRFGGAPGHSPW
jgi:hypothetical protein